MTKSHFDFAQRDVPCLVRLSEVEAIIFILLCGIYSMNSNPLFIDT